MKNIPHNIYIHVPFCMSKCNYCAFFSTACANPDWEKYANDICNEIIFWGQKLGHIDIPTVFFGGGTPSLMPTHAFEKILNAIRHNFNLLPDAEITLESNPGTLSRDKLHEFQSFGVNRLSVGVQSLDDKRLEFLGRQHSASDAITLLENARNTGMRVSADFIYGLPNDTVTDVADMCRHINTLGLMHCSMYELTIESGTPFFNMNLTMPDNETMAQMYTTITDVLNLPRYEVSNYATPGHECQHNLNVWDGAPYIGIGRGAAGRVFADNAWYEQLGAGARFAQLPTNARAVEKVLTGMRMVRGCLLTDDVKNVIDMDWVNQNPQYVNCQDGRIVATSRGMLILDEIVLKLVK